MIDAITSAVIASRRAKEPATDAANWGIRTRLRDRARIVRIVVVKWRLHYRWRERVADGGKVCERK